MGYPVMLNLAGKPCVVVGGGRVAARKVRDLLQSEAQITLISPALDSVLASLAREMSITVVAQPYAAGMLAVYRPFLVIVATDVPAVNREVLAEARALNCLVNVANMPEVSDFHNMGTVRRGPLTLAIASEGAAPALTAHVRQRMEACVGPEYETLALWMAELRPEIRTHLDLQSARAAFWQQVIDSPVLAYLREGDFHRARSALQALVREASQS